MFANLINATPVETKLAKMIAIFEGSTGKGFARKLQKEAKELEDSSEDLTEIADCIICTLGVANKAGYSITQVFEAVDKKLDINLSRTWLKLDDGTWQHVPTTEV